MRKLNLILLKAYLMNHKSYLSYIVISVLVTLMVINLNSCVNQYKDADNKLSLSPSDTADASLSDTMLKIIKLNNKIITDTDNLESGMSATIEIITRRNDINMFLMVHPKSVDSWWVQNQPVLKGKGSDNLYHWEGEVYLGTENQGLDDTYHVLVISGFNSSKFSGGKQLKVADVNHLISQPNSSSEQITIKRVNN